HLSFCLTLRCPPRPTPSPYTTLFRSEHEAADEHVMHVRDDEMRVVRLPVEGDDRDHHARQAADDEDEEEAEQVEHRQLQLRPARSEEHTSELQSRENLVCRLLLEKKK